MENLSAFPFATAAGAFPGNEEGLRAGALFLHRPVGFARGDVSG